MPNYVIYRYVTGLAISYPFLVSIYTRLLAIPWLPGDVSGCVGWVDCMVWYGMVWYGDRIIFIVKVLKIEHKKG
jgi:hypothetical protein